MTMDFDAINNAQLVSWFVLAAFVVMYPKDAMMLPVYVLLRVGLVVLNCFLMLQAWRIHRQIRADFAKLGLPPPAFHFTPIWDR
jgi:hypothetical protein